jgi:mannose-6-phosphate isomerase-like protein (cupin superfamily)
LTNKGFISVEMADVPVELVAKHRGGGFPAQELPFETDGHGYNIWASIATSEDGFFSPRHRHNFDQIRFVLTGSAQFASWELEAGDCGYFPESVPYGPQAQTGEAVVFALQMSGGSGNYFARPSEVSSAFLELRAKDPNFGEKGAGRDAEGRARDSYELVWESIRNEPIDYAEPRYGDVVIMRPQHFKWTPLDEYREVKPLGSFTEHNLQVLSARLTGPSRLGIDTEKQSEIWLLTAGSLTIDGRSFSAPSAFQLLPGTPGQEVERADSAEFLVVRLHGDRGHGPSM